MAENEANQVEPEGKAGYGLVISLTITAMIGTGLFFGPAIAASYAGNASIIAWALLGLIGLYVGFCFAEVSGLFPESGGVYQYAKKAYGRFSSFLVGWITWLVGSVTATLLIVAALDYLVPSYSPLVKISLSILILLVLTGVAIKGIEASTAILLFFASITMLMILAVIIIGFFQIEPANYVPIFSPGQSPAIILLALFFILESFNGWESPTLMSGEVKNPQKIIPRSILYTSIIVSILIVLFPIIFLGLYPSDVLAGMEAPVLTITTQLFGALGADIFRIAMFLGFIGSAAGGIVSTPRLIQALAKDKLFIEQLSKIHPRLKTPVKAIIFQTFVSLFVIFFAFGDYESLLSLLIPLTLFMYASVILTVPVLRRKYPTLHREVKAPFGNVGPFVLALIYIGVIIAWLVVVPNSFSLFKQLLSLVFFGIPIYFLMNLYYNPEALQRMVNSLAFLNRGLEGVTLPKRVRHDILNLFETFEGKTVLEFGAGVGSLTIPLAEKVGPNGKIFAVDLSKNNISILTKRLAKKKHTHVQPLHDEHFISRIHPDVTQVDMIYSVGNLSYIQDIKRILKDMNDLLPENGRICLVEYVNYFWGMLPDQPWLEEEVVLKQMFRDAGFSVTIKKRRALFWTYMYIYGIKSKYDVPVI